MTLYGQIELVGGVEVFVAEVRHDILGSDMIKRLANGRHSLRPIEVQVDPPFDPETQKLGPPNYEILVTKVRKSHIPIALTVEELRNITLTRISDTDEGLMKAVEALVDTLIAKNIMALIDLPPEARDVLNERNNLRAKLSV